MSRGHLGSSRKPKWYSLEDPPALSEIRRLARNQGYTLRTAGSKRFTITNDSGNVVRSGSTRSPHYWLVHHKTLEVLTPRLTLQQVWLAVALPSTHARVEGFWLSDE